MDRNDHDEDNLATDDMVPPGIDLVPPSRQPEDPPKDQGNADAELKEAGDE